MKTSDILISKSLKVFIKGSLVLIGLFAILYCGIIALLLRPDKNFDISKNIETSKNIDKYNDNNELGKNNEITKNVIIDKKNVTGRNIEDNVLILIFSLVGLPIVVFVIVFFRFSCLLKFYYIRISDSSDNEGIFLNIHDINALTDVYRMALKAKNIIKRNMIRQCKIVKRNI